MASPTIPLNTGAKLSHLEVRNFAIIDDQSLDFSDGMTVLTGETGAGKSLIVDALNIAIGERANADLVQSGASNAEVNATFEPGPLASAWLEDKSLDDEDGLCALRRVISADRRSRAFINGRPVPITQLKELGACLVDVHGQHANQSLLKNEVQRQILDAFGNHQPLLDPLIKTYHEIRKLDDEIKQLQSPSLDSGPRVDYLRYQIDELEGQALEPSEYSTLNVEHRKLSHGAELIEALNGLLGGLDEDQFSASSRIADALSRIESLKRLDSALDEPAQTLTQAQEIISEAVTFLRHYAENIDPDTARLMQLENQLSALEDLARKHQCPADQLKDRLNNLQDALQEAETADERLQTALVQRETIFTQYNGLAKDLGAKRQSTGKRLQLAVTRELSRLGLEKAKLEIQLTRLAEDHLSVHGCERIEFQVSTNPGQPMRSLARVVSGGELSRIALALQTVAIGDNGIPTIVFDEVDTGIGGRVAEIVGRLMRDLGQQRQVLTVTHLPQVASMAHHHIRVSKLNDTDRSRTVLRNLDNNQRVDEIARMLAGIEVTENSRAHAQEMLSTALGPPPASKKSRA